MSTAAGTDRVAIERWAGEVRVNLVRVVALVAFYGYHLFDVYQNRDNPAYSPEYRSAVAAVAFAWAGVVVSPTPVCGGASLPTALSAFTTLADAGLVTAFVTVSGGPKSTPLVLLYLLVVAASPPRMSLPMVWLATAAAGLGYLVALGHYVFIRIGTAAYYCRPGAANPAATGGDHDAGHPHGRPARRAGGAAVVASGGRRRGGAAMTEPRCPQCSRTGAARVSRLPVLRDAVRPGAGGVCRSSLRPSAKVTATWRPSTRVWQSWRASVRWAVSPLFCRAGLPAGFAGDWPSDGGRAVTARGRQAREGIAARAHRDVQLGLRWRVVFALIIVSAVAAIGQVCSGPAQVVCRCRPASPTARSCSAALACSFSPAAACRDRRPGSLPVETTGGARPGRVPRRRVRGQAAVRRSPAASTGREAAAWAADGKTITTGLIGAYLAVEFAKWLLGIRIKTGDSFALPLALALAVGRWGCFFNGCCYGRETDLPWACDFGDGVLRHPTQVYESLFHLTMAGVLLWLMGRGLLRTHRLQLYLIAYGVFRFLTEYLRPEPEWFGGLTFYQWVAVVLIVGLAGQWWWEATGVRLSQAPRPLARDLRARRLRADGR